MQELSDISSIERCIVKDSTLLGIANVNYIPYEDTFGIKLKSEIQGPALLEKISYIVVALYILSVENRFKENNASMQSKFYKVLLDYYNPSGKTMISELFLNKAVELAYLYLPDRFPFVS